MKPLMVFSLVVSDSLAIQKIEQPETLFLKSHYSHLFFPFNKGIWHRQAVVIPNIYWMNVAHDSHHVHLLQKILATGESSWSWKARKSTRSWQDPKRYGSCFLRVTSVFILVLLSLSTFPAVSAGSTVYKSSLGTIPCLPMFMTRKLIFPVETP